MLDNFGRMSVHAPYVLLLAGLPALPAMGQDCNLPFTAPLFPVAVETGIVFDTVVRYDGGVDTLKLDLYKPIGDGQAQRPLIVTVHGGAFVSGDRSDMAEVCELMASCGWTAATISYRLGFHPQAILPLPFAYDEQEVVRAAYRGLLDTRSAVRFLKARSAQDSTHMGKVVLLGASAGGINALHAAYARDESQRPAAAGALGPVTLGAGTYERPDLGPLHAGGPGAPGDDVLAVVSFLGGVLDTAMIVSASDPALFMYHQTGDPIVGCGHERGLWGMPLGVSESYPYLFGSCMIAQRAQHLGFAPERFVFHEYAGNEHDIHDLSLLVAQTLQFARDQVCATPVGVHDDAAPFDQAIHPNPTTGRIKLPGHLFSDGPAILEVMDASGRVLLRSRASDPVIDLTGLPRGLYLLTVAGWRQRVVLE